MSADRSPQRLAPAVRALFLSVVLLASCAGKPHPFTTILVGVDTLRKDYVGHYNPKRADLTPNIDGLLADSVTCENAYTVVPQTFPSFASVFTGVYPWRHGVVTNQGFSIRKEYACLAERFQSAGYATAAVIGGRPLRFGKGLERGFSTYEDNMFHRPATGNPLFTAQNEDWVRYYSSQRPAMDVTQSALDIMDADAPPAKPLFLFLHYFDPHTPYSPPEEYLRKCPGEPYAAEVAYTDSAIGKVLRHLKDRGRYDEALIVFFADHGEGLGDHGEPYHGYFLYEATVAVPLGIKLPRSLNAAAGTRIAAAASLMDIGPTICELQGMQVASGLDGRSLAPLIRKPARTMDRDIILSTEMPYFFFGWEKLFADLRYPLKAIVCSEPQVYDLGSDPGEKRNLYPKAYADLAGAAQGAVAASEATPAAGEVNREEIENLKALGYLTSFQKPSKRESIPPSRWPDKIKAVSDVDEARFQGDTQAVLTIYSEFLKEHPDDFQSLVGRAEIYLRLNQLGPAEADLSRALRINDNNFDVHNLLIALYQRSGNTARFHAEVEYARKRFSDYLFMRPIVEDLLLQKQPEAAREFLRAMMASNPGDAYPFLRTLGLLMDADRRREAEAFVGQILRDGKAGPAIRSHFEGFDEYMKNNSNAALGHFLDSCADGATFYQPYYYAGLIYKERSDWSNAVRYLNAARILAPENPSALYAWADGLAASGAVAEAVQGFRRASEMDPKNPSPRLALLRCALILGKPAEAEANRAWLAAHAPQALAAAHAQDPVLKKLMR